MSWWVLTAIVARFPSTIQLTDACYALSLAWTYIAGWAIAAARSRDRQRTWFKAIALTSAFILTLAVLEGAAALKLVDYRRIAEAVSGTEGPDVGFIDDPVILFRRVPNMRWSGLPRTDMSSYFNLPFRADHPLVFSTDRNGFRNSGVLQRAAVALIGDSYVEGWGVSDDETAAARLSQKIGQPVANLGTAGYGSLQELRVLERYALPLRPRYAAWFFFEGNDLDDDQNFENAMLAEGTAAGAPPAQPIGRRWRDFTNRSFTRTVFMQMRQLTGGLVPSQINTYGYFRDASGTKRQIYFFDFYATRELGDFERERLKTTEATLRQAAETCRRNNVAFAVYFIPMKFRVYRDVCEFPSGSPCPRWRPWDLESEMRAICDRAGIAFVSLTGPMRAAAARGALLYAAADSHWNAAGQAFVADQLATAWASIEGAARQP